MMKTDEFKVSLSTSKGTQSKWHIDNMWYKRDYLGAEGASEYVVSCLLKCSNIAKYAEYTPVLINKEFLEKTFTSHSRQSIAKIKSDLNRSSVNTGCISTNFLADNEEIVTLYRLLQSYCFLTPKDEKVFERLSTIDKLKYTVSLVEDTLGVFGFGNYLTAMLELDCIICNEDRHLNNICVIRDSGAQSYKLAPVFDNGLSLLADYGDYTWDEPISHCIKRVKARPFNISFDKQVAAAEKLYGQQLYIDTSKLNWEEMGKNILAVYKDTKYLRCLDVLRRQLNIYTQYVKPLSSNLKKLNLD